MALGKFKCRWCGKTGWKPNGHINRSHSIKAPLYCSVSCSGYARRNGKDKEQKKLEKRLYDMEYRKKNRAILKAKKAAAYQERPQWRREYEKEYRKKNMQRHVKYCSRPEYKEWKQKYDEQYRAKKEVGEFWEAFILAIHIDKEVKSRLGKADLAVAKGYYNKSQQRRRAYEKLIGIKSQKYFMGNAKRNQNRQDAPGAGR